MTKGLPPKPVKDDKAKPTLKPPGSLTNEHGVFLLQNVHMRMLVRYIWSGCLLATSRNEYAQRLGFSQADVDDEAWPKIDSLIGVYNQV